jgi:hypothetical protein
MTGKFLWKREILPLHLQVMLLGSGCTGYIGPKENSQIPCTNGHYVSYKYGDFKLSISPILIEYTG